MTQYTEEGERYMRGLYESLRVAFSAPKGQCQVCRIDLAPDAKDALCSACGELVWDDMRRRGVTLFESIMRVRVALRSYARGVPAVLKNDDTGEPR